MKTKYRVKVRRVPDPRLPGRQLPPFWIATCPVEHMQMGGYLGSLTHVGSFVSCQEWATQHAAHCKELHWRNWEAACPSCKSYGRVAKACPVCLGRGFEHEQEGLE